MNVADIVWVGLAGGLGALARFVLDGVLRGRVASLLPVGTITINITGSFLLGLLTGLVMFHAAPSALTLVAGTGFCGGYTTFSTSSFETVRLAQQGDLRGALVTGGTTVLGSLCAAGAGLAVALL